MPLRLKGFIVEHKKAPKQVRDLAIHLGSEATQSDALIVVRSCAAT